MRSCNMYIYIYIRIQDTCIMCSYFWLYDVYQPYLRSVLVWKRNLNIQGRSPSAGERRRSTGSRARKGHIGRRIDFHTWWMQGPRMTSTRVPHVVRMGKARLRRHSRSRKRGATSRLRQARGRLHQHLPPRQEHRVPIAAPESLPHQGRRARQGIPRSTGKPIELQQDHQLGEPKSRHSSSKSSNREA